jgi:hypothetical protein
MKKTRSLITVCEEMREQISATQAGEGGITGQVRLRENIGEVYGAVAGYPGRPAELQIRALEHYAGQVKEFEKRIDDLIRNEIPEMRK